MEELNSACQQLAWKKHAIDMRLSIPFPGRGVYVVFLAGRERRSAERLRAEGYLRLYKFVLGLGVLAGLITTTGIAVFQLTQPFWASIYDSEVGETGIPWLTTQAACENTGRIWRQNQCWDEEHSPDF